MPRHPRKNVSISPGAKVNHVRADFLRIDAEVALTFSSIASMAKDGDEEKKRRTTKAARRAYDTILRLREKVELTDAEETKLDESMQRLKKELQSLGETF